MSINASMLFWAVYISLILVGLAYLIGKVVF